MNKQKIEIVWNLLNDRILKSSIINEKLCIPITGGLDSRLLAGIISQYREIDYGYYFFTQKSKNNVYYVEKLRNLCRIKEFDHAQMKYISMDEVRWWHKINAKSDHVLLINKCMDVFSGYFPTKKREFNYFVNRIPQITERTKSLIVGWKDIVEPFYDPQITAILMSLTRTERFCQRFYVAMIYKYLPEIAEIPRCFEFGHGKPVKTKNCFFYLLGRLRDKKWRIGR